MFMQFGISESGGLLANVEAKSMFIEEIKAKQFEDGDLDEIRTKIAIVKSQWTTLDDNGVLNYKGRMCVPRVENSILWLLAEAYGSHYSIHSRMTKMYRDLKRVC